MSSVAKGIGNVVKKIGGAVKSIVSGIGKVFKKVWESPLGKIIMIAAAIYLGGWALGAWTGPGGGVGFLANSGLSQALGIGATVPGAAGAGAGVADTLGVVATDIGGAGAAAGNVVAGNVALPGLGAGGFVGGAAPAVGGAAPTLQTIGSGIVSNPISSFITNPTLSSAVNGIVSNPISSSIVNGASTTAAQSGLSGFGNLLKSGIGKIGDLGGWIQKNPWPSMMGLQAIGDYLTPSEIEQAANERKKQVAEQNANNSARLNLGSVMMSPLQRTSGGRVYDPVTGLMNPYSGVA